MGLFTKIFDNKAETETGGDAKRMRCACGLVHGPQASAEDCSSDFVVRTFERALFPDREQRRALMKAVGVNTLRAAIASVIPVGSLQAMVMDVRGPLEKKTLNVGFVPITCSTPLLMAAPLGMFSMQNLDVKLVKSPSWSAIETQIRTGKTDASHFLSPMPIAMSMGLGGRERLETSVATIQNTNGQAITLAKKHKDRRESKLWKGMRFGVPSEYSMHNLLLRYYVAEHGLDPDHDIAIVVTPPPEMVKHLRDGTLDGFLSPDPFNQRAVYDGVGFIHALSRDIWDGHPCCAFGATNKFIQANPNTFGALYRAVLNSSVFVGVSVDRASIAKAISTPEFLDQPVEVVEQVLTGKYPDGLGTMHHVEERVQFDPVPWPSMAVWMLTQMRRWGYIKGDVEYQQLAEKVFLIADAKAQLRSAGWRTPDDRRPKLTIMGRTFDASKPTDYVNSFTIRA